jgi:hypothetical protein
MNGRLQIGLSAVVPEPFRASERARVTTQLRSRLEPRTSISIDRQLAETALLRGVATDRYDMVELGAVAGRMAVEAGVATPLVQPQLAGSWTYEGQLHRIESTADEPTDSPRLAGGSPLSTPTHAAVDALRAASSVDPEVRWHTAREIALGSDRFTFLASDEFTGPTETTVDRNYRLPVPALYARRRLGETEMLRGLCSSVAGGQNWFGTVRRPPTEPVSDWLGEHSQPNH